MAVYKGERLSKEKERMFVGDDAASKKQEAWTDSKDLI